MAQSDDDYRTLKPTDDTDDRYGTLAPPQKAAPLPAPKRSAPRPARPAGSEPVAPTLPPGTPAARLEGPAAIGERPAARPMPQVLRPAGKLAAPYCRLFPLSAEAARLLDEKQTVLVYLYRLMNERLYMDAARLLAHALPRREGVRWACDCARSQAGSNPAALEAVEAWLIVADEPNRRACGAAASAAGHGTTAGSAALAVFLSGGSIAPADRPAAAPGEHLASRAVANAVILAALSGEPGATGERYFQYLKEGIALATGAAARG